MNTSRGISTIVIILIVIFLAILVGVYLSTHPNILNSKASNSELTIQGAGLKFQGTQTIVTQPSLNLNINLSISELAANDIFAGTENPTSLIPSDNNPSQMIWIRYSTNPANLGSQNAQALTTNPMSLSIDLSNLSPGAQSIFLQILYPNGKQSLKSVDFVYQPQ